MTGIHFIQEDFRGCRELPKVNFLTPQRHPSVAAEMWQLVKFEGMGAPTAALVIQPQQYLFKVSGSEGGSAWILTDLSI